MNIEKDFGWEVPRGGLSIALRAAAELLVLIGFIGVLIAADIYAYAVWGPQ